MEGFIKSGTIVVAIEAESTSCGIKYVRAGSILKTSEDVETWRESVAIFRNYREEYNNDPHYIQRNKLRLATQEECEMYANGNYYLQTA